MPKIRANEINHYYTKISKWNWEEDHQRTALAVAIINNKDKSVQCLLKCAKVDHNLVLESKTISKTNKNCMKFIAKKVAFHFAIENDFTNILKLIIENKDVDLSKKYINEVFENSQKKENIVESIAYFAVRNAKVESLKTLLNNSEIDINDTSERIDYFNKVKETRTAFQFANKLDNYDLIKLLQENNAKSNYDRKTF